MKERNEKNSRELLGLELINLIIKKSRLRWFGLIKHKDDTDWVKHCTTLEIEGIRQRDAQRRPNWSTLRTTWKVAPSQKDAQFRNK